MKPRWCVPVCLLVLAGLFAGSAAWGQTNGTIRGTVLDQTGAVVPGAIVTVRLTGTDSTRSVTADKDGAFDIPWNSRWASTS